MSVTVIKWLQAILSGVLGAILFYFQSGPAAPSGMSTVLWGAVLAVGVKVFGYLLARVDAKPTV